MAAASGLAFHGGRLGVIVAVRSQEGVAHAAEGIDTAVDRVPPDVAVLRLVLPGARFPGHRLAGADINRVLPGVAWRQLLGTEDLGRLPEPRDPHRIVGGDWVAGVA
jgi:hypothetical protein